MPVVRFEPAGVEVDVAPGEALIDVIDEHPEARVPLGCRDASCGTCRVTVLDGASALEPPSADERTLLATLGAGPSTRVCCQLRVRDARTRVVLRVVGAANSAS